MNYLHPITAVPVCLAFLPRVTIPFIRTHALETCWLLYSISNNHHCKIPAVDTLKSDH